ncbi:hypothetical protein AB4037_33770 [Labrys sp. KB_33_2]|uniref:hypothetical protein n=1 Tax=Labrys sp. KB_33_2 TaxID=3237479 RepID=UPI003F93B767
MPVAIRPATLRDMTFIAATMRDQDRREIRAVIEESDTAIGTMLFHSSTDLAWTAWIDGDPVAAFGVTRLFPGLGSGWAYGTRRMRRAVPAVTRFARSSVRPLLIAEGFRRIEVRTAIDHDLSHRWLEGLGFRREGIALDYGRGGLDFVTYAATGSRS